MAGAFVTWKIHILIIPMTLTTIGKVRADILDLPCVLQVLFTKGMVEIRLVSLPGSLDNLSDSTKKKIEGCLK